MHATKHDLASNKMTSTGFDYFGVCDVVFPSLPTALTIPAPVPPSLPTALTTPAPAPPDTHIIGTYRIYKELDGGTLKDKLYISVYRSDEKTGYVEGVARKKDGVRKKTKVVFHKVTRRTGYSNGHMAIYPIELMPVGHIGK